MSDVVRVPSVGFAPRDRDTIALSRRLSRLVRRVAADVTVAYDRNSCGPAATCRYCLPARRRV